MKAESAPKTFRDVIALWPKDADFARDVGIAPKHLATLKGRGSLPPKYWAAAIAGAQQRKIKVTTDDLAAIATKKSRKRRKLK